MRGLDGQARIFIGSSSEGRAAAETAASALEAAGMRPLLWSDFFKTRDLPLQELDRRMADADGAILVGSADDRLVSRGNEFDQMRDNVLFEYGLFAGHLGRHRCILLMPDHPRFRIPSDFLGVAGFELYTGETLREVAKKVPERLQAGFAADGFKPPSLQERCRRLLLLSGWMRSEVAKIKLERSRHSLKEQLGLKVDAVLCFLKEDIDELALREDVTLLQELVERAVHSFPYIPSRSEIEDELSRDVERFLMEPRRYSLPSRDAYRDYRPDRFDRRIGYPFDFRGERLLNYAMNSHICPWCDPDRHCQYWERDRPYMHSFLPIEGSHYHYLDGPKGPRCAGFGWRWGAIDMLAFMRERLGVFDGAISSLEAWQQEWVPQVLARLGNMEQAVHKQIFGHL
jgi:Predicted nucleotide-binding protein containing TIR-like domain